MTVWLLDEESDSHFLTAAFTSSFFAYGPHSELHNLCESIRAARWPVKLRRAQRYDLFLRSEIELLEIVVQDPSRFPLIVQTVRRWKPALTYYNCTVPLAQMYFYQHHLFPLARVEVETDANNQIRTIGLCDSPWAIDYEIPQMKWMTIRVQGDESNPNHGAHRLRLEIGVKGTTRILQDDDPRELLIQVKELLERYDPDLIITRYGDSYIFPRLLAMSASIGVPLPLNRDGSRAIQFRRERSYFTYGRIMYRSASHTLFGRLHIDLENCYLFDDYQFDGLFEMARLAQMPVQRAARTTTGTCLTSMQMSNAFNQNILIPSVKQETEAFQSAEELVVADKGGLIFLPAAPKMYEKVAEFDFSSMFPSIMDTFNVSAETLNCACCPTAYVPELDVRVCQKRRGLIPTTLAPLIAKRRRLKEKMRLLPPGRERERYKRLAACGKWAGVVSFGYLGHKNAMFGNITAHQAICAFSRDKLLMTKELAEQRGFRMLHAIVDAIYIQKKNARAEEYDELARVISESTGLRIELEGVYNWICFPPSRQAPHLGVANRYFGVFENGEMKIRGIELRRRDTPEFIKAIQRQLLDELTKASTRAEIAAALPHLLQIVTRAIDRLRSGQVPLNELVLNFHLSRNPEEYSTNTLNAIVARELSSRGVRLQPGEGISYVITDYDADTPSARVQAWDFIDGTCGYDAERYTELLVRAAETLLWPFGVSPIMLRGWLRNELPTEYIQARLGARTARAYLGPLFERTVRAESLPKSSPIYYAPSIERNALAVSMP